MRVFLGGTYSESASEWRDEIMPMLDEAGIEYFNPLVDDWNDEAQTRELQERATCDFCLYTITPKMTGVYSIAEVVDDSNKNPEGTVLVLLREHDGSRFSDKAWFSLRAVSALVKRNGAAVFYDLTHAVLYLCRRNREGKQ